MSTDRTTAPARHRMIPGSHERHDGPECVCGATWDRRNDRCTAPDDAHAATLARIEGRTRRAKQGVAGFALVPLTCDNEASPRGAGNTAEGSDPPIRLQRRRAGVSLPSDEIPATFPVSDFWAKVDKSGDCWTWTGQLHDGYGRVMHRRKNYRVHRVAWLLDGRAIPDCLVLDHLCRVRRCVRPDHMETVPNRVNVLRGVGLSAVNATKTHCPQGHAYEGRNLVIQQKADGGQIRNCRTCRNERGALRSARRVICPDCGASTRSTNMPRHRRESCPVVRQEAGQ